MKNPLLLLGCSILVSAVCLADEAALIAKLASGTTTEKDAARIELLTQITPASIPALTAQLANAATFDNACFLLGALANPAADDALAAALPKADPMQQAALLITLRRRGCGKALDLAKTLCKGSASCRAEAQRYVAAFAPDAATLLAAVPMAADSADALLRGAIALEGKAPAEASKIDSALESSTLPENFRLAAYCGLLRCAGNDVFALLVKGLSNPSPLWYGTAARQAALQPKDFLTKRGNDLMAAIPQQGQVAFLQELVSEKTCLELIRSSVQKGGTSEKALPLFLAAINGLGTLGDRSDVPGLLALLGNSKDAVAEEARKALIQIDDKKANDALLSALAEQKADEGKMVKIIRILAVRNAPAAQQIAAQLTDSRATVRTEAFISLSDLATPAELAAVTAAALKTADNKENNAAAKAVNALAKKYPAPMTDALLAVLPQAKDEKLNGFFNALGIAGTDKAYTELTKRVDANGAEADEALRVLANGQGQAVMRALLGYAANYPKTNLRILALRGALRLMAAEKDDAVLMEATRKAIPLVSRPEERMLLTGIRDPRVKNAILSPIAFKVHRIGTCRTEACGVADFNGDGKPDIVAGPFLYLAPEFKAVQVREVQSEVKEDGKGYAHDFMNLPLDVSGNGKPDIVAGDWFSQETWWFENILPSTGLWTKHLIEKTGNIETGTLVDLDGDGKKTDFMPDTFITCLYNASKDKDGHAAMIRDSVSNDRCDMGTGCGDLNGDGKNDILRPVAWFEKTAQGWKRHPLNIGFGDGKLGHASNMIVYDVNKDGLNDIIVSSAHRYGIFWWEQQKERTKEGELQFTKHLIDDSWTQAHYLGWGDIDNDGIPEIVTGKRFMAHNGGDPDPYGKVGVYYYDFTPGPNPTFQKHVISFDEGISVGLNIETVDMDGDGDLDLVTTGKWGGPVLLENLSK